MEFERCPYLVLSEPKCFARASDHLPDRDEQSEYCKGVEYRLCAIYRQVPQWKKVVVEMTGGFGSSTSDRVSEN